MGHKSLQMLSTEETTSLAFTNGTFNDACFYESKVAHDQINININNKTMHIS